MSKTIVYAIIAVAALIVLGAVSIFAPESLGDFGSTAVVVIGAIGVVGSARGKSTKSTKSDERGFSALRLLAMAFFVGALFVVIGMFIPGCASTYTVDYAEVQVQPLGPEGASVRVYLTDSQQACRVDAQKAVIQTTSSVAQRICALYPESCTWSP